MVNVIKIYTDGGCIGNPGPGGWACILNCNGYEKEFVGGEMHTTNNKMELLAVINALKALKKDGQVVEIYSDSQYIVNAFNQKWIDKWQRQGWSRRKNIDLWLELLELVKKHQCSFIWVKGHNGHNYNERCDYLATTEAARQKELCEQREPIGIYEMLFE